MIETVEQESDTQDRRRSQESTERVVLEDNGGQEEMELEDEEKRMKLRKAAGIDDIPIEA